MNINWDRCPNNRFDSCNEIHASANARKTRVINQPDSSVQFFDKLLKITIRAEVGNGTALNFTKQWYQLALWWQNGSDLKNLISRAFQSSVRIVSSQCQLKLEKIAENREWRSDQESRTAGEGCSNGRATRWINISMFLKKATTILLCSITGGVNLAFVDSALLRRLKQGRQESLF